MIFGFLFYFFAMKIELLNPGYLAIIGILYNWTKNYVSWEGRSSLAFKPTNSQKFVIVQKKYLNFYLFIYWKISVLWLMMLTKMGALLELIADNCQILH